MPDSVLGGERTVCTKHLHVQAVDLAAHQESRHRPDCRLGDFQARQPGQTVCQDFRDHRQRFRRCDDVQVTDGRSRPSGIRPTAQSAIADTSDTRYYHGREYRGSLWK
jgi:hypothetical protein